jgi:hypothetical protein
MDKNLSGGEKDSASVRKEPAESPLSQPRLTEIVELSARAIGWHSGSDTEGWLNHKRRQIKLACEEAQWEAFKQFSDILTGGNASTFKQLLHALQQLRQQLEAETKIRRRTSDCLRELQKQTEEQMQCITTRTRERDAYKLRCEQAEADNEAISQTDELAGHCKRPATSSEAIAATNEIKSLLLRGSEPHPDEILAIVQSAVTRACEEAMKLQLLIDLPGSLEDQAELQQLRQQLEHLKYSNHGYKPDSCSLCGAIK